MPRKPFTKSLLAYGSVFIILGIGGCGGGSDDAGSAAESTSSVSSVHAVGFRDAQGWQIGLTGILVSDLVALSLSGQDVSTLRQRETDIEGGVADGALFFNSDRPLSESFLQSPAILTVTTNSGQSDIPIEFVTIGTMEFNPASGEIPNVQALAASSKKSSCPEPKLFAMPTPKPISCKYKSKDCQDGFVHPGVDFSTSGKIQSVADGKVEKVVINGSGDHGLGNVVIIGHEMGCRTYYSLYAHLDTIDSRVKVGKKVDVGQTIGVAGATGNGKRSNWKKSHLHFELKPLPILGNPAGVGTKKSSCDTVVGSKNAAANSCFGRVVGDPANYGYFDPNVFFSRVNSSINPF